MKEKLTTFFFEPNTYKPTTFFFTHDISDRHKYINLYAGTIDEFMKHNPPCKKCLVQPTCILSNDTYIKIKTCNKIEKFMANNKYFY